MYTQDRNLDSVKCTLRTGIRTVGSVQSGQKSGQWEVYAHGIGTVCSVHAGQESVQWEMYTHDRNQDIGKCTLRTEIEILCSVHSGQESRQWEVYTQGIGTV